MRFAYSAVDSPLLVGSEDVEYYPHYGKASVKSDQLSGFVRDLLDAFSEQTGIPLRYQLMPVKRLYRAFFYDGSVGLKYPDNIHWNTKGRLGVDIHYSDPVVTVIDGVMTRTDRPDFCIDQLFTLGTIRGFTPEPYLDAIKNKKIVLIEYNKTSDMLIALLSKRIDGVYMNVDVAKFQLAQIKSAEGRIRFNTKLPFSRVDYHLSTVKHPAVLAAFNQFMKDQALLVESLKAKYGVQHSDLPNAVTEPQSCTVSS